MSNVGKNIRILRTEKGLSQNELAKRSLVSFQSVSDYESGKAEPDIDTLTKIADILNVDANTLIYGIPEKTESRIKNLMIAVFLIIVLFLGFFLIHLSSDLRILNGTRFNAVPSLFLNTFVFPGYFSFAGWFAMYAAGCILHARPLSGRICRIAHVLLINILALYYILAVLGSLHLFNRFAPWINAVFDILALTVLPHLPLTFFILGILLWITKSSRPAPIN